VFERFQVVNLLHNRFLTSLVAFRKHDHSHFSQYFVLLLMFLVLVLLFIFILLFISL